MNRKEKIFSGIGITLKWLVLLAPVLLLLLIIVEAWLDFQFLHIQASGQGLLLSLIPTIVLGIMQIVNRFDPLHVVVQSILVALCVLYMLPLGFIFCAFTFDFYSETENLAHYMQVDDLCNLNVTAQTLFPEQPQLDGKYYYHCDYDHDHILFAEWTLAPDELAAEVARVEKLLSAQERYQEMQYGNYRCLIAAAYTSPSCTPFEVADRSTSHCMTMFAYNEVTGIVRYLSNQNFAHRGQVPWYMTLDWDAGESELP